MGVELSKKGGSAPDPYATAAAQTTSNQQTANYNADLNRVSQYTPYGNSVYTQTGTTPSGAPQWRQDVTLSPLAQQELENEQKQDAALSNLGFGLADQAGKAFSNPLDTSGLPALSGAPTAGSIQNSYGGYGNVQTGIGGYGKAQTSLGDTGKIQSSLDYSKLPQLYGGNDFQQSARDTANAVYQQAASRLDPQWTNTQNQQDAKLANQGVLFGTGAYGKAQTQLDQARNDAYNQANYSSILAGNDEQQRLFQDSLAQRQQLAGEVTTAGNFANSAQAQKYAQALSSGNFANAGQQQNYEQALGSGAFANAAQQQAYGQSQGNASFANAAQQQRYAQDLSGAQFGNQARAQGLTEATNLRNLPLNELNALRSATQIANPQFSAVPQSNAAGTDIQGAIYKSAELDAANSNNFMNGLFGLGSAAITKYSDRRLKRDIKRIGETPIMKLPLYAFRYLWDDVLHVGVMAQEAIKVCPKAVSIRHGFMAVDYSVLA